MYWEASNQTYIPIESNSGQTSDESKKEKSKDSKTDKVKIAKKIAKDMEKWAKTLNQKKETSRMWVPNDSIINSEPNQSSVSLKNLNTDPVFASNDFQTSLIESEPINLDPIKAETKTSLESNPFYLSPYQIMKDEENRLTDWDKLACLLCKRQFSSQELLTKHQQISDLHKVRGCLFFVTFL